MKNLKRPLSALLLVAMLASVAACGDNSIDNDDTTSNDEQSSVETTAGELVAVLPDTKYNTTFTILTRTTYDFEFAAEELTADTMNDAVYYRNSSVEDRFGVDIVTVPTPCTWGDEATAFNTTLRASIMSGGGEYDLVAGYAATIGKIVEKGMLLDLNELTYVDFSKPWWSEQVNEEFTINGKCYMMTGDASIALWQNMRALFFNKRIAENYNVEDLYALVKSGSWTFDKLIEVTKDVYEDLDGDSTQSTGDLYGFILGYSTEVDNLQDAFELSVTEKDSDGFPYIAVKTERRVDAVQKINSYVWDSGSVFFNTNANTYRTENANMFSEGRGLILTTTLGQSEIMRAMDDDFGILPYPKYDEDQESYHSTSLDEFSMFVVPSDVSNPEMSGVILEALCYEGYKTVVPEFYNVALKTKAARDDESSEMIDIIRDTLTFDFGYLNSSAIGGVGHVFVGLIRGNSNEVMSKYDEKMATYEDNLEKLFEAYK